MKYSTPKACAILAIVISWIILLRLLTFHSTSEEIVLPPSKLRTPNIIGKIVLSIISREANITEGKKLNIMGSRNASEVVDPDRFTVYIHPKDISIQKSSKQKLSILIIVTSVPKATGRRKDIRSTWMKWAKESSDKYYVRILFFMGLSKSASIFDIQELINENNIHNDLIVDDFFENYFRLTPKTLRMLKWYIQTFGESNESGSPDFLVKTDHDVFINVPNLNLYLLSIVSNASDLSTFSRASLLPGAESKKVLTSPSSLYSSSKSPETPISLPWYFIGGEVYNDPPIESESYSKFYVDAEFWFGKSISHFPSYAGGPLYVLSGNIIPYVYNAAFSVPLFYFEDAYLLGLVANQHLHLKLTNIPGVYSNTAQSMKAIRNKFKISRMIALHSMEPPVLMHNVFNIVVGNMTLK